MEEIKAILTKYDIAASVIINGPDRGHQYSEFLSHVKTSWSCAFFEGPYLRIRTRLQEDYNGDKEKRDTALQDTVRMVQGFAETGFLLVESFENMLGMLKSHIDIDDGPGKLTIKGHGEN